MIEILAIDDDEVRKTNIQKIKITRKEIYSKMESDEKVARIHVLNNYSLT